MTLGYIVESDRAMELDERDGLLYFGSKATLFPTRRKAQNAIAATIIERPAWGEEFKPLQITRIVSLGVNHGN